MIPIMREKKLLEEERGNRTIEKKRGGGEKKNGRGPFLVPGGERGLVKKGLPLGEKTMEGGGGKKEMTLKEMELFSHQFGKGEGGNAEEKMSI